jgi:pentatricopeptide repeat protein
MCAGFPPRESCGSLTWKPLAQITQSALINACIDCNELERARELYKAMQKSGHVPSLLAFNNLINAHGRAGRLGDAIALLRDLAAAKLKPDAFTFAAVLNACQRANEAELAFDVYRCGLPAAPASMQGAHHVHAHLQLPPRMLLSLVHSSCPVPIVNIFLLRD